MLSLHVSQGALQAGTYPGSVVFMKQLGVFLLLPARGAVTPAQSLPAPVYTPGWREALKEQSFLPKNTMHQPGLEHKQLLPKTSALTRRSPRLPEEYMDYITYIVTNYVTWIIVVHKSKRTIVYCDGQEAEIIGVTNT